MTPSTVRIKVIKDKTYPLAEGRVYTADAELQGAEWGWVIPLFPYDDRTRSPRYYGSRGSILAEHYEAEAVGFCGGCDGGAESDDYLCSSCRMG
jgi:hypothetical protein